MTARPPNEEGAALLAVLALVLLLAGFASVGLAQLRAATDQVADADARAEAQLLAQAGVAASLNLAAQVKARANRQRSTVTEPVTVPFAGGTVRVRFSDGGNCFNLNSLAPMPGADTGQALPADFSRLLQAAGIPFLDAARLAEATMARLAGTRILWADASEWLTVPGVTRAHWEIAGPLLCALPVREASPINANSLTADKAPLLIALGVPPDAARRAIASRPADGWTTSNAFWTDATPDGQPATSGADVVGVSSRWMALELVAETPRARVTRRLLLDTVRQPARVAASLWETTEVVG
jgi:general secretion pathway protein K